MTQNDAEKLEAFRQVLARLHDDAYLQTCQWVRELAPDEQLSSRERANRLRTAILRGIEELSPGPEVPVRSAQGRSYNVLNLHYVEGLMVREVARELAVSERQVYRDLRTAEARLWQILEADVQRLAKSAGNDASLSDRALLVDREVERLSGARQRFLFAELLEGVLGAARPLAQRRGIDIQLAAQAGLGEMTMDRQVTRHALLSLLSSILQSATGPTIRLLVARRGEAIAIKLQCAVGPVETAESLVPTACSQLLRHTGSHCTVDLSGAEAEVQLLLHDRVRPTVLVIDDNEGLIALFERYLDGQPYHMLFAHNGVEGLKLVQSRQPAVVILDVMMPERDGWETLQYLRNTESTRHIPVIVCSVLDDPELAYSLGASGFIAKPVTQESLLRCLREHL
jgi:CheY-like chemotaxis protein